MPANDNANAPAQLLIQSQLLQLYSKGAPIRQVRTCAWTNRLDSSNDARPDLHALVIDTNGNFIDYVRSDGPYTSWTANRFGGTDDDAAQIQAGFYAGNLHVFKLSNSLLYQFDMSASRPVWVRVGIDKVHAFMASSHAGSVYFDQGHGVSAIDPGSPTLRSLPGSADLKNIRSIRLAQIAVDSQPPTALLEVNGKHNSNLVTYYLDLTTGSLAAQQPGWLRSADVWSADGSHRVSLWLDLSSNSLSYQLSSPQANRGSVVISVLANDIVMFEAVATSATTVEVFALDDSYQLSHWVFEGGQPPTTTIVLADRISSFAVQVVDGMLELGVVAATATSSTFGLFKITRAIDGLWRTLPVYYNTRDSASDPLLTYPCFRTDVTVGDENGIAVAGAPIYFLPNEDDVEVDINGVVHLVDANDPPLELVTNAMGRATFTVNTSTLHTPQILVWTDFTGGRRVLVEPNGPIQTTLRTIDAAGLSAARKQKPDGSPGAMLLPAGTDTGDLATALNETMALGESDAERPGQDETYLFFARDTDHVFVADADNAARHTRLAKASIRDKHFTVRFDAGRVVFERHTRASAKQAMLRATASAEQFIGSVDDVLQGALDGSLQITAFTISDASSEGDPSGILDALFEFIVDGVNYVVEGLIEYVRQAFAAVESIFASIGAFFSDVFAWLGELFAWQDILNTQTVIEGAVSSALASVPARIASNTAYWQQLVTHLAALPEASALGHVSAGESANAGIATSNQGRAQDASVDGRGAVSGTPQSNWAMSLLADSTRAPTITPAGDGVALLASFPDTSIASLTNQDDAQAILDGFFNDLYDQQGDITWGSVSTAVENLVTALGVAALSSIGETVLATMEQALQVMRALLEYEIDVPILTDLYASITDGKRLTILSLISLIAAIPATICYKLCSGNVAPFTTSSPVSNLQITVATAISTYRSSVTAPTIFPASFLARAQVTGAASSPAQDVPIMVLSWGLGFVYGTLYTLAGVVDTWERTTDASVSGQWKWRGAPVSLLMLFAQSVSSPYLGDGPYPTNPAVTLYYEQITWYYQWVMTGCDAIRLIAQFHGRDANSQQLAFCYSVLGLGHMFLFGAIAGSDQANNLPETDYALKTTQNMLTAVGGLASWPYGKFLDWIGKDVPAVGVISSVYSLLFWIAPGVLNIARTVIAMEQGIEQVDL